MMRNWWWILLLTLTTLTAHAEELPPPSFGSMIGALPSSEHSYIAESWLTLPVLRLDPVTVAYQYAETTPFLKDNAQAELLYTRYELEADFALCDPVRLIAVGGYQRTQNEDRPGYLEAYVVGGGVGSPLGRSRLEWSVVAGGYLNREYLDSDWWANGHAVWRVWEGAEREAFGGPYRPALGLAADVESSNDGGDFRARYRLGPVLEVVSANGNQVTFEARWYHTDGNPFYGSRDNGMLLGVSVNSSFDQDKLLHARDERPEGILPVVWGQYAIGYGNEQMVQKFELDAEIHDFMIADHRVTAVVWYQSRQDQRSGNTDNITYSVSPGLQTPIDLESILSQGQPLVLGCDYEHRSGHALNPDVSLPPGTYLERDSVNIAPRVRLQTLGWDLPYRDPTMYNRKSEFLNYFDWRATIGYVFYESRNRSNPAGQLGLNWDAATIQGGVLYARGVVSMGDEIPDWNFECGVRRPWGKVYFSVEREGLEEDLGGGTSITAGVGFNL